MVQISPLPSNAARATANNQIKFKSCKLWFYPPGFVWSRLQGLHRASLLRRADGHHLPQAWAQRAYKTAWSTTMGSFWSSPTSGRVKLFSALLDTVGKS